MWSTETTVTKNIAGDKINLLCVAKKAGKVWIPQIRETRKQSNTSSQKIKMH